MGEQEFTLPYVWTHQLLIVSWCLKLSLTPEVCASTFTVEPVNLVGNEKWEIQSLPPTIHWKRMTEMLEQARVAIVLEFQRGSLEGSCNSYRANIISKVFSGRTIQH